MHELGIQIYIGQHREMVAGWRMWTAYDDYIDINDNVYNFKLLNVIDWWDY